MSDLLIRNARVLDGTGAPEQAMDVRVRAGRIAEVGVSLAAGTEPLGCQKWIEVYRRRSRNDYER